MANTNLNSLTAHGIYYSVNAANSATLSNCPISDSGFSLEVSFGMATIIQNLIPTAKELAGTFIVGDISQILGVLGISLKAQ